MFGLMVALGGCTVLPEPFGKQTLEDRARFNLSTVASDQDPVDGPIDLYEAMARALKYNLDYRVAMMEEAVRSRELERARMDMLPQLVANSGYAHRNNDSGGTSISILTRRESLEPSTSVERSYWASDLTLSWDILDFGLSYVRARQAADQVLISLENRRKVANRMIEDVRTVYWRAISAQRLLGQLGELERQVETSLRESVELEQRRTTNPLAALNYQRELIDVQRQVQALQRELVISKAQLAALMNVAPDTPIELEIPNRNAASTDICWTNQDLALAALENRPELREVAYRLRINQKEDKVAWLRNLPNLKAFLGVNYDTNEYLYNQHWVNWGVRGSWNLLNTLRYPEEQSVVRAQEGWLRERERALTMAIMTQVHVGRAQYAYARKALETAGRLNGIQDRILLQSMAQASAGQESRQKLVREELNSMLSQVRYDLAYADMQTAYANVHSAIGLDSFAPDIRGTESIADLSSALRRLWEQRRDPGAVPEAPCSPGATLAHAPVPMETAR